MNINLSPREIEVLQHMSNGLSAKQMARAMSLKESTINSYSINAFRKLQVNNRAQAVAIALKSNKIQ